MNDDLIAINHQLGIQSQLLQQKLKIAKKGLNVIILEGSDNLKIAEKTLEAMKGCDKEFPHEESEQE